MARLGPHSWSNRDSTGLGLNGSNGRFFDISLENENDGEVPTIYQIGTDLGFLQDVVPIGSGQDTTSLLLGPAERADVIVDFSEYAGDTLTVKTMRASRS